MPRTARNRSPPPDSHIGRRPKVCAACRKVKHKCVPSNVPGQCARCVSRTEPCNYGVPVQEDAWKQWATHEIQRLSDAVFTLERRTRGEDASSQEATEPEPAGPSRPTPSGTFATPDFAAITTITQPSDIYGLVPGSERPPNNRHEPVLNSLPEIGEADPRPNVISKSIVTAPEARALVTYFLHTLGQSGTFHFGLCVGSYPLLSRLEDLTPFIMGTICHVSAQRMPAFHHLISVLETDTVPPEVEEEEDPTIDIELGIGPEEISALALRAVFTGDAVASRSGLTWARGLGKLDASGVATVSMAELVGLSTPRRQPTRQQSLRLILFAYVCRVYTAVVTDDPVPEFDPLDVIHEFTQGMDRELQVQDEPLVMHAQLTRVFARFCLWRQRGRNRRQPEPEPDFDQALKNLYPDNLHPGLALWTPIFWYARLRVLREKQNSEWQQHMAACKVVEALDGVHSQLAGLPLIYLEAARLAGTVVLDSPGRDAPLDQLEQIAFALLASSLPADHLAPKYGASLLEHTQRARNSLGGPSTCTLPSVPYHHDPI
ncbi:uncharacterized protein CcaverHIS019_0701980 [Cutaneotrichosporon cavernicola]|uniref:Zn(2)-C6 fungal-type domain-containing protein n=1 Tax=Cutaneotrichosporon cavernicola TaxID=279322 RepID=A0AA48L9F8_9TREE|nr:uncharacterized protein CcaverHIS019_0701980 [Cutaneotrichosporon cavernicola]BEI94626.1 hypothetical protein CcaverHIS019_0701980 [Cutaneotrichosporon cavernicola]BEJ02403.1 hypothetical protein CcaverHIS631_0701980 [Cutaneotrichosporon cavernicola]BEJ10161.1 hypothetical protein CcaverHIS641_0701960 [Cutaneotrichosporon cavernicola]